MHDVAGPKRRSAPSRRLSLAGVILVGITIIAAGLTIWDHREEAIASYRREITNLGIALAEQTARAMQGVDLVLKEVQAEVVARGTHTPEQLRRVMGTEAVHRYLVSRRETLPQAYAVGLIDADGALLNGSRQWPTPAMDLSDRDYFTHFRDHKDAGIFIGAPRRDLVSGEWAFFLGAASAGHAGNSLGSCWR
jgi:hypothetical protein